MQPVRSVVLCVSLFLVLECHGVFGCIKLAKKIFGRGKKPEPPKGEPQLSAKVHRDPSCKKGYPGGSGRTQVDCFSDGETHKHQYTEDEIRCELEPMGIKKVSSGPCPGDEEEYANFEREPSREERIQAIKQRLRAARKKNEQEKLQQQGNEKADQNGGKNAHSGDAPAYYY